MASHNELPVELPDGRLVCGPHGLVVCHTCAVDFTLEDESDGKSHPLEALARMLPPNRDLILGTGSVIPTKFIPPSRGDTPQSLFYFNTGGEAKLCTRRIDKTQLLIFADGACLDNGGQNPRAGCAFVYRPSAQPPSLLGFTRFRLEDEGPTGEQHPQTSNRAELRAVIAVLRFRDWVREGFHSLVIATDSEYVAEGITCWVRRWISNGWKTSTGAPVKNQDLWQCLLGEVEWWHARTMRVQFWRIPREWNTDADYNAKQAASMDRRDTFADLLGV